MLLIINERIINYIQSFFLHKKNFLYFKFIYIIKFLRNRYANCVIIINYFFREVDLEDLLLHVVVAM